MKTLLIRPFGLTLLALGLLVTTGCRPRTYASVDTSKQAAMTNDIPMPSGWTIVRFSADGQTRDALNTKGFVALRDGQIGGHTGCNAFGGDYTGSVTKMKVGGVFSTKMYCDDVNEQERAVLELFNGNVTAAMEDGLLVLSGNDIRLMLKRDDSHLKE